MTSLFCGAMMYTTPLENALLFTIKTIFSIYISIVLIRLLLQFVKADFYNPVAQFIVTATNPIIKPLRRFIPGWFGVDWSCVLVALGLQATETILSLLVKGYSVPPTAISISGLLIWSLGELIDICLVIFLFATFVQIIASWIQPNQYNPLTLLCEQITAPLFKPVRRFVPNFGMLDFSPIVVIFLIILMRLLIADYLVALGRSII
jgi:YggT family protein